MAGLMYAKPKKKTEAEKKKEKIEKYKASRYKMAKKSVAKQKAIKKKKEKKPSVRKVMKSCDSLFSKIVRLRDGHCQKCGSERFLQNSHTIPRSASKYLYFDEQNCIALCMKCHLYWWHKNPIEATLWFQTKFPERYQYLIESREKIANRSIEDYIILREQLKIRLKELENGQG